MTHSTPPWRFLKPWRVSGGDGRDVTLADDDLLVADREGHGASWTTNTSA